MTERVKFESWSEFRDVLQGGLAAMAGMREDPPGFARRIKALYRQVGLDYADFDREPLTANVVDFDSFAEWQKGTREVFRAIIARLGVLSGKLEIDVRPYNFDKMMARPKDWDGVHAVHLAVVEMCQMVGAHLGELEKRDVPEPPAPPVVAPELEPKPIEPGVPPVTRQETEAATGSKLPSLADIGALVAENRRLVAAFPALISQIRDAENDKKGIEGVIEGIELEIQAAVNSELTDDGKRAYPNAEARKAEQYARTTAHEGFREYSQKLTGAEIGLVALQDQLDQLQRELSNNRAIMRIYEGVLKAAHLYTEGEN